MGNQDCGYRKQRKGGKVGKNTHDNRMKPGSNTKGELGDEREEWEGEETMMDDGGE